MASGVPLNIELLSYLNIETPKKAGSRKIKRGKKFITPPGDSYLDYLNTEDIGFSEYKFKR